MVSITRSSIFLKHDSTAYHRRAGDKYNISIFSQKPSIQKLNIIYNSRIATYRNSVADFKWSHY